MTWIYVQLPYPVAARAVGGKQTVLALAGFGNLICSEGNRTRILSRESRAA